MVMSHAITCYSTFRYSMSYPREPDEGFVDITDLIAPLEGVLIPSDRALAAPSAEAPRAGHARRGRSFCAAFESALRLFLFKD